MARNTESKQKHTNEQADFCKQLLNRQNVDPF